MTEQALAELAPVVGVRSACKALGRARATHYRTTASVRRRDLRTTRPHRPNLSPGP
jgi:hypothetical protein